MDTGLNHTYDPAFQRDVLNGFAATNRYISPCWLYDHTGSVFFEKITELPEYYVTRTEVSILNKIAPDLARVIGDHASLVEYGAGAAFKARIILDALETPEEYVAVDISFDHLKQALDELASLYPHVDVHPLKGDFLSGEMAKDLHEKSQKVGFFPGSTIGNLTPSQINQFLSGAREFLGDEAYFILGADLRKSPDILIPAYDDAQGVTADFNKNLLVRINKELDGTINVDEFEHKAIWNDDKSRIEMHLEAQSHQSFEICGKYFEMEKGETLHTENSRKFTIEELRQIFSDNGWDLIMTETDKDEMFSVNLLKAK